MDVVIIGGGPAGATAAVYTARAGFKTTLIYKDFGALEKAERVENFYGFTKISGKSLVEKGLRQARLSGAKTIRDEVVGISVGNTTRGNIITVETPAKTFEATAVLLAVGANRHTPDIPGLSNFEGCGVSHCAICDGFFYRGKNVAVLGSGAYALHEAEDLLPLALSVTLLTNGAELSVDFPPSVTIRTEKIREVHGGNKAPVTPIIPGLPSLSSKIPSEILEGVIFENGENLPISGLFVAEGIAGGTELARKIGASINPQNAININTEQHTTISGLWAAGDCTGGLKQIAKATYEGAEAGLSIVKFLRGK